MSVLAKILLQFANPEFIHVKPISPLEFKGWVANQQYLVDSVESNTKFTLRVYDVSDLNLSLANDCNKFFTASVESICGIAKEPKFPKTAAWAIIRAYYASFYSAHCLLRIFSNPCSHLEFEYIKKIVEMSRVSPGIGNFTPSQGYYNIKYEQNSKLLIFEKLSDSHADTWHEFKNTIDNLVSLLPKAKATDKNRVEVYDFLTSLKNSLCQNGCAGKGNWLSKLRNSVNYKLSHGIWFPYSGNTRVNEEIVTDSLYWRNEALTNIDKIHNSNELKSFIFICATIVSLAKNMIEVLDEKSDSKKSIFKDCSIKSLNLSKI